jgi:hypothetical protein
LIGSSCGNNCNLSALINGVHLIDLQQFINLIELINAKLVNP